MNHRKLSSLLAASLCALLVYFVADCANDKLRSRELEGWKSVAKVETEQAKFWRNKEGQSRAQAKVAEANIKIIEQTYRAEIKGLREKLAIKPKNLNALTTITTTTTDTLVVTLRDTIFSDTTHARAFSYRDRWITMNGHFLRTEAFITYNVKDSITLATSYRRKNFFGKRQLYVDAISHNPNTTVTGIKSISVPQRRPGRLGIGPFVGYGLGAGPVVGVGVSYHLIRF